MNTLGWMSSLVQLPSRSLCDSPELGFAGAIIGDMRETWVFMCKRQVFRRVRKWNRSMVSYNNCLLLIGVLQAVSFSLDLCCHLFLSLFPPPSSCFLPPSPLTSASGSSADHVLHNLKAKAIDLPVDTESCMPNSSTQIYDLAQSAELTN